MYLRSVYWILIFFLMLKKYHAVEERRSEMKRKHEMISRESDEASSSYDTSRTPCETDKIHMSSREYVELGFKLQNDKEYNTALACFSKAISLDPLEAKFYRYRADCYFEMGDLPKAKEDYKAAGQRNPPNKYKQLVLIRELFNNDLFKEAIKETLIMNDPEQLVSLGNKFTIVKRYDEALLCYDMAISDKPSNARYYRQRAKYYVVRKMFSQAIADFREAVRLNPGGSLDNQMFNVKEYEPILSELVANLSTGELKMLCDELRSAKRYKDAIHCYTMAIDGNLIDMQNYLQRGKCYLDINEPVMAASDFVLALQMDPNIEENHVLLRQALLNVETFDESLFHEATKSLTDIDNRILAHEYISKSKFKEAIHCLTEAIEKNSSQTLYYRLRSISYLEIQEVEPAILDLRKVIELEPNNGIWSQLSETLFYSRHSGIVGVFLSKLEDTELERLGNEFSSSGKNEAALRCYNAAVQKNPQCVRYYIKRGQIYDQLMNFEAAIQDFFEAVRLDPQNNKNRAFLRITLAKMKTFSFATQLIISALSDTELGSIGHESYLNGNMEAAIHFYTEAIKKNPTEALYYIHRGKYYRSMGNLNMMLSDFGVALTIAPKDRNYYFSIREALSEGESLQDVPEELLALLPEEDIVFIAREFDLKAKPEEEIRLYNILINKNPSEANYYRKRGKCLLKTGNWISAVSDIVTGIELAPYDLIHQTTFISMLTNNSERFSQVPQEQLFRLQPAVIGKLGYEFFNDGKIEEALHCYNIVLTKDPSLMFYYEQRGRCYVNMANWSMAAANLAIMVQLDPNNESNRLSLRHILLHRVENFSEISEETLLVLSEHELMTLALDFTSAKKHQNALRCCSILLQKNPTRAEYYRMRANCHMEMKVLHMAISDFREVLKIEPLSRNDRITLSRLLFDVGKYTEAIDESLLAHEDGREIANLGERFFQIEKFQEAISCYTEAIKANPTMPSHYKRRGICYMRIGNLQRALADLRKITQLGDLSFSARLFCIELLAKTKHFEKAERVLEASMRLQLSDSQRDQLHKLRQEVKELKDEDRRDKLMDYLKGLVIEDSENQKLEIMKENRLKGGDVEVGEKINNVWQKRDKHLKDITDAYAEFKTYKISRELDFANSLMEEPKYFLDAITMELMDNAVITPNGISYDQAELMTYLHTKSIDPCTRDPLHPDDLRPNLALREAIRDWKETNGRS